MRLNTKAIVPRILSLNIFAFLPMSFSGNTLHSIPSPNLRLVPHSFFFTNPSLPLFPPDTSLDPSTILLIPPVHSSISPLEHPLAIDHVIDQTSLLPLAAPLALPLATPLADSPISPQEPVPPMDPISDQTPPLLLHRSAQVRAPLTHLCDYSCFSIVISLHEPHTYREACTNPLWQ